MIEFFGWAETCLPFKTDIERIVCDFTSPMQFLWHWNTGTIKKQKQVNDGQNPWPFHFSVLFVFQFWINFVLKLDHGQSLAEWTLCPYGKFYFFSVTIVMISFENQSPWVTMWVANGVLENDSRSRKLVHFDFIWACIS